MRISPVRVMQRDGLSVIVRTMIADRATMLDTLSVGRSARYRTYKSITTRPS
jgi:hypothetical protein